MYLNVKHNNYLHDLHTVENLKQVAKCDSQHLFKYSKSDDGNNIEVINHGPNWGLEKGNFNFLIFR